MDLLTLIQHRRSCRSFTKQAVEPSKIAMLQKAALWSPTSKNKRPWEFLVVDDKTMLEQLAQCKEHGASFLDSAPLAIVVMADPTKSDVWIEDTAIAASYLQLMAEELGLGSCWIQVRKRKQVDGLAASEIVKKIIGAPHHWEVASIIAIGYKDSERGPYNENDCRTEQWHSGKIGD